jgi:hypothetical protein
MQRLMRGRRSVPPAPKQAPPTACSSPLRALQAGSPVVAISTAAPLSTLRARMASQLLPLLESAGVPFLWE